MNAPTSRGAAVADLLERVAAPDFGAGRLLCLTPDHRDALLALYRSRVDWFAAHGLEQWRAQDEPVVAARFAERLAAGAVFGVLTPTGDVVAALTLDAVGKLWAELPHPYPEPVLFLDKLLTHPGRAPAGTGSHLLAWAEAAAAAAGYGLLRMDCLEASLPLRRFWHERGYFPRDEAEFPTGHRVLLCEKRLRPLPAPDAALTELPEDIALAPFDGAIRATLLFVIQDGRILLIDKKRGHGAGLINGPGGKCDPGETPRDCAIREVREELLIDVETPRYLAELRFQDTDGSRIHGFVYVADGFTGTPTETAEARPRWFDLDAVPYELMWADDRMWLPWVLAGVPVHACVLTRGPRVETGFLGFDLAPEPH